MGDTSEVQTPIWTLENQRRQPCARDWKRTLSAKEEQPLPENHGRVLRSLQRGSSFTFLTPGPQWDFSLIVEDVILQERAH
uniref:neuroepithelial cell-transforming gene 1 protein-like n=1 Tax=Monopterus albus TaxID=43700 RepID=UPI0009B3B747|nr:neuroepithelial cell-transforming gene 1 protein-like [Monopterus albus]